MTDLPPATNPETPVEPTPPKKRSWRRRLKKALARVGVWLAQMTLPYLYLGYMRLVWATSKVEEEVDCLWHLLETPPYKAVGCVWHQDVFCVAWVFGVFKPYTLASVGDFGEVITRMLQLCGYTVFRGGSSSGKARKVEILQDLIEHTNRVSVGALGVTVDGSNGPAYRLKRGGIAVARNCQIPLFVARVWCKHRILLPTWDRTMIPLPFNHILVCMEGPFLCPPDLDDPEALERFRQFLENRLLNLTYRCYQRIDGHVIPRFLQGFPEGWKPE